MSEEDSDPDVAALGEEDLRKELLKVWSLISLALCLSSTPAPAAGMQCACQCVCCHTAELQIAGRSPMQSQRQAACNCMGGTGRRLKGGHAWDEAGPLACVRAPQAQPHGTAQTGRKLRHQVVMPESAISSARIRVQARETNARLRKELHLEHERRQIAVGALIGSS